MKLLTNENKDYYKNIYYKAKYITTKTNILVKR